MMASLNVYPASMGKTQSSFWEKVLSTNAYDKRLGTDVHRITETHGMDLAGCEVSHIEIGVIHTFGGAA